MVRAAMKPSASDLDVSARYRAIRSAANGTGSLAILQIGEEQTILAVGDSLDAPATLTMAIGAQRTAREFFKRSGPSPLELENAIATAEDEVMRARTLAQASPTLYTTDPSIRTIAVLSGVTEGAAMIHYVDLPDQA